MSTIIETVVVHPVTGEKEKFVGGTQEEVQALIAERFGEN